ncbi:hypothetical protein O181_064339 [Austropuccinia psidii MF-1]|uniref:Chromo domain-containing protein n=1 Tax=Austropuccinia psidii MF-1 TaxID=1389203 RepID=A0A9Q3ENW3_9BASI|nr:hypothetical protein [Austropuccinia psidii MF-1]
MIQTLEITIRRFCAYGLDLKDSDGLSHDWCTLILSLQLANKTSVHASSGQIPAILEKGWNPRLPADRLRKDLIEIHPKAFSFKVILDKAKHHEKQCPKKLKYSYLGPFVIADLNVTNAVQVELSVELENKHPTFPVNLIKPCQPTGKELFPLTNPTPLTVPPVEQDKKDKNIKKVIKERILRGKNQSKYLVRYTNPVHEDEWLAELEIPGSYKLLRGFSHERRPQA